MWSLREPDEALLGTMLARQASLPLSYPDRDASVNSPPPGYDFDHHRVQLGTGEIAYQDACEALRGWHQFPPGWTRIWPARLPLEPGRTVTVRARVFGIWFLNACRIVHIFDEPRQFGLTYGTLPDHVESGEERFLVEWLPDDSVWYDLRAISRPGKWLTWLGYPLVRWIQKRFARDSMRAMVHQVRGEA